MNSWKLWHRKKLEERLNNLKLAEKDDEVKAILRERAKRDPIFFFNQFAYTYDPRPEAKPNHFPFITYEFQDDLIRELDSSLKNVHDLGVDKSRDMGVSWVVLTWLVHKWLFDPVFNALIGSRKEDLVDNFQPDSLFGKLSYCIDGLPSWLLPKGYNKREHRRYLKIINPETGNTLQGESANRDFSRQGRYTVIFLDEFAFWEFADSVWTATADSAPIRIPVSTPHGKSNKFADLRFSGTMRFKSLHWSLHPLKDQNWYEKEKLRRTSRETAQELDIDYEASGTERVFNLKTNKELRDNIVIEPFELPQDWNFRGGLDYGTRNYSSFHVYVRDYDKGHFAVWEWRRTMEELKHEGFQGSMVQAIARMLFFDCPYYDLLDHIRGDPNLWVKNQNSEDEMKSVVRQIYEELEKLQKEYLKEKSIKKEIKSFLPGAQSDIACIQVLNGMWAEPKNPQFKIFKNCTGLIQEIEELEWEEWSEAQKTVRNLREKIRDRNNHSWDDFKYYLMSYHDPAQKEQKVPAFGSGGWYLEQLARDGGFDDIVNIYRK